jgi:hypothetical protein
VDCGWLRVNVAIGRMSVAGADRKAPPSKPECFTLSASAAMRA